MHLDTVPGISSSIIHTIFKLLPSIILSSLLWILIIAAAIYLCGCGPLTASATLSIGGSAGSKQDIKIAQELVPQPTATPTEEIVFN